MDTEQAFESLAISLGLGLLVGLQRERVGSRIAGVRTFPLITMLGTISALLGQVVGGWIVPAALIGVVATTATANFLALRHEGARSTGLTTEIAIVLMFALGAYAAVGPPAVVLVVGGITALLLHLKGGLHGIVARIGDKDMRAIMLFVALAFVVLPVLPNEPFGPMGVWNPRRIWMVVVLVVGIGLGGYIAYKFFGKGAGTVIGGVLGGLISSTATTLNYARQTLAAAGRHHDAALIVILVATAVMYLRVIAEVVVIAPHFADYAVPPLLVVAAAGATVAAAAWTWAGNDRLEIPEPDNPSELRPALVFAGIYAAITLLVATAQRYLGESGTLVVAALAGTVNMDAITLSTAALAEHALNADTQSALAHVPADIAWRAIVVAAMSNLLFKVCAVAVLGHRGRLLKALVLAFAAQLLVGLAVVAFWPSGFSVPLFW